MQAWHTYIHTIIHTYTHTHIYIYTHTHIHTHIYIYTHTNTHFITKFKDCPNNNISKLDEQGALATRLPTRQYVLQPKHMPIQMKEPWRQQHKVFKSICVSIHVDMHCTCVCLVLQLCRHWVPLTARRTPLRSGLRTSATLFLRLLALYNSQPSLCPYCFAAMQFGGGVQRQRHFHERTEEKSIKMADVMAENRNGHLQNNKPTALHQTAWEI
jgi:hypothetical protein